LTGDGVEEKSDFLVWSRLVDVVVEAAMGDGDAKSKAVLLRAAAAGVEGFDGSWGVGANRRESTGDIDERPSTDLNGAIGEKGAGEHRDEARRGEGAPKSNGSKLPSSGLGFRVVLLRLGVLAGVMGEQSITNDGEKLVPISDCSIAMDGG
jgi:hypothetical protein